MILRLWPYIAIAMLALTAYGLYQRGNAKDVALAATQAQLVEQMAQTEAANKAAQERAVALKAREATLAALNTQTSRYRARLAAITRSPDGASDACINQPIPDSINRLLREAFPDPGGSAGQPSPDR